MENTKFNELFIKPWKAKCCGKTGTIKQNGIERCFTCNRPTNTLGKIGPFKVGDVVSPIRKYTYSRRLFKIVYIFNDGSYRLEHLGGKEKGTIIEKYDFWELKGVPERVKD